MMLSDVRDYIASLPISETVYMGKLDAKDDKSIGVYNLKSSRPYTTAIGGHQNESYGMKYVSFLVHWNKSPRDTEKASVGLFEALRDTREVTINNETIKFVQLLNSDPIDVGTDDNGIYETVIEAAFIYEKGKDKESDE